MKNKRGFQLTLSLVVVALILIITAFVVIGSFTNIFGKGTGELKKGITLNQDSDGDGIINAFDKCPCASGSEEYNGCSSKESIPGTPDQIERARSCLENS